MRADIVASRPIKTGATLDGDIRDSQDIGKDVDDDVTPLLAAKIYRVYPERHFQLALFSLLTFTTGFQWIAYASKLDAFVRYFDVPSALYVNLLALLFMAVYPLVIMPTIWVFSSGPTASASKAIQPADDKPEEHHASPWLAFSCDGGLRRGVVIGATLAAAGGILRWLAVAQFLTLSGQDRYAVAVVGQTLAAVGQVFVLGVPPDIASTWFGANERNGAAGLAIAANSMGIAASFLTSLAIDDAHFGEDVSVYFLVQAVVSSISFLLILFFFKNNPPTPASRSSQSGDDEDDAITNFYEQSLPDGSECEQQQHAKYSTWTTAQKIRDLMGMWSFVCMCMSFGLMMAASFGLSTVIAEVLGPPFPAYSQYVGAVGCLMVVCGTAGAMVAGWVLDKTHRYHAAYICTCLGTLLSGALFHLVLEYAPLSDPLTYYGVCFLVVICSIFSLGAVPIGYQYASELFYPHSDAMVANLLNNTANIVGTVLVVAMSLMDESAPVTDPDQPGVYTMGPSMLILLGTLAVACVFTIGIKGDLKRSLRDCET